MPPSQRRRRKAKIATKAGRWRVSARWRGSGLGLGSHGALAQTDKTATPGRPCTAIQQLSVGLDLNLPVGTSVARAGCDLTKQSASATAAWLTAIGWVLRLLAWAFAALFIAGFTSAVRKT